MRFFDLTGKHIGILAVQWPVGKNKYRCVCWLCLCECGNLTMVTTSNLRAGTISCGCRKVKSIGERTTTHGLTRVGIKRTPEYNAWHNMIQRCTNQKNHAYPSYGYRGIKVCARWLNSFENFLADMGHKPSPELSLERIDNDCGYEFSNCMWATKKEQSDNKRTTIWRRRYGTLSPLP